MAGTQPGGVPGPRQAQPTPAGLDGTRPGSRQHRQKVLMTGGERLTQVGQDVPGMDRQRRAALVTRRERGGSGQEFGLR